MQTVKLVKDLIGRKYVAHQRKMLWVEEGRGESQEAGPSF